MPFMSTLKYAVTADATVLEFNTPVTDLCAAIAAPAHVFLTVYTAQGNETVVATACDGTKVTVIRAMDGTERRAWPAQACVCELRVVPGRICGDPAATGEDVHIDCCQCMDGIQAAGGIEVVRGDGCSVTVGLEPTGVEPGTYCGLEINAYGQITFIPPTFPASCLPVFDPCGPCDGAGGGEPGPVAANLISYTPALGACVALGTNVQTVIEQIDDALCMLQNISVGVLSLSAGDGLVLSGPATNPTVSMNSVGISPGIYGGFTVNGFGQVLGYVAPPPPAPLAGAGTNPISVTNVPGGFTVSVQDATSTQRGVVLLAAPSDVLNSTPPPGDAVITYAAVDITYARKATKIATAINSGLNGGGDIGADRTLVLDITNLPGKVTPIIDSDELAISAAGGHERVSIAQARHDLRAAWALGRYNAAVPGVTSGVNIAAAVTTGTYVDITIAAALTNYVVTVTPEAVTGYAVVVLGPNLFRVQFSVAPPSFMFAVFPGV